MFFLKRLIFMGLALLLSSFLRAESPSILYLTWSGDPTSTMTIHWHGGKLDKKSEVNYRKQGEETWLEKGGYFNRLPHSDFLVHTVQLVDLEPGTNYEFLIEGKEAVYRFRTMPSTLEKPIRFCVGGDAYYYLNLFRKMNRQIASHNPDFVVVGGDIAYTHGNRTIFKGKGWQIRRWRTFFKEWKEQMVTSDGRLIPLVPVVGNHDVRPAGLQPFSNNLLFFELFAWPEKGTSFRTLDFGSYLSFFILDTGHVYFIKGEQTQWLKTSLSEREKTPYKMAAYHIGAYPSVYPYEGPVPCQLRQNWSPLFEEYHLNVAFEHHNHAYKRTHPIKGGQIDPSGVVYMGDGSWGVGSRRIKNDKMWYLEKAQKINAFCLVDLDQTSAKIKAISINGKVIDEMVTLPGGHSVIESVAQ